MALGSFSGLMFLASCRLLSLFDGARLVRFFLSVRICSSLLLIASRCLHDRSGWVRESRSCFVLLELNFQRGDLGLFGLASRIAHL